MLNPRVVIVLISIYFSFLSVIFVHHFPFLYIIIPQEVCIWCYHFEKLHLKNIM